MNVDSQRDHRAVAIEQSALNNLNRPSASCCSGTLVWEKADFSPPSKGASIGNARRLGILGRLPEGRFYRPHTQFRGFRVNHIGKTALHD
jgi:hypothetical protein